MALLKYFNSITVLYDDIFDIFSNRRKYQFGRGVPREVKIVSGVLGCWNRSVFWFLSTWVSPTVLFRKLCRKCFTLRPTRFFTEVWRTLNGFHTVLYRTLSLFSIVIIFFKIILFLLCRIYWSDSTTIFSSILNFLMISYGSGFYFQ